MQSTDMVFNFIGVSVVDWHSAFMFFSKTLGLKFKLEPKHGDWAVFGSAWDAYYRDGNRSAVFELFDHGRAVTERRWGLNQGIRPGFHVSNLQSAVYNFPVPYSIEEHPWGKIAEFNTIEGIRFALTEIPNAQYSDDPSKPYIGHVAIKCANFEAMQNFYENVLGFTRTESGEDYAIFAQKDRHPSIILEHGGSASAFDPWGTSWEKNAVRAFPVFLSLMTTDIQSAYTQLQSKEATILRDIITDQSWGGTDLHIADPDGNGIQVVQYG